MKRIAFILAVAVCAIGIGLALAEPPDHAGDRADARTEALASRAARAAARNAAPPGEDPGDTFVTTLPHRNFREQPLPSPEEVAAAAGCDSGAMLWRRDHGVEQCAALCDHDGDCAEGERCRVLPAGVRDSRADGGVVGAARDAPPTPEIGRASCRERV